MIFSAKRVANETDFRHFLSNVEQSDLLEYARRQVIAITTIIYVLFILIFIYLLQLKNVLDQLTLLSVLIPSGLLSRSEFE